VRRSKTLLNQTHDTAKAASVFAYFVYYSSQQQLHTIRIFHHDNYSSTPH
jgi:hypothetical protein